MICFPALSPSPPPKVQAHLRDYARLNSTSYTPQLSLGDQLTLDATEQRRGAGGDNLDFFVMSGDKSGEYRRASSRDWLPVSGSSSSTGNGGRRDSYSSVPLDEI